MISEPSSYRRVLRRFLGTLVLLTALTSTAGAAPLADTTWIPRGIPLCIAPRGQSLNGLISDGKGGAIVLWDDDRNGTNTLGHPQIFAQHVTAIGGIAPGWDSEGNPLCADTTVTFGPSAVSDGAGGATVVFFARRNGATRLYVQRFDGSGAPQWPDCGVRVCTFDSGVSGKAITPDGAGGVIIAWADNRNSAPPEPPHFHYSYNIYAQRFSAQGERLWNDDGVRVCTFVSTQERPVLLADGDGGARVFWHDGRGYLFEQHLDGAGNLMWAASGVALVGVPDAIMVPTGDGGVIACWADLTSSGYEDVFAQRIGPSGEEMWSPIWVPVCEAPGNQWLTAATTDGVGGAVLVWQDGRGGQAWYDWDIYAQRITDTGRPAPGWPINGLPVCNAYYFQVSPTAVSDGAGGVLIAWYDARNTVDDDIYAQRITGSGRVAAGWPENGVAVCTAPGHQVSPVATTDGAGGAIIAWDDDRAGVDIYAQRVSSYGVVGDTQTPALMSLVSADGDLGFVRLRWFGVLPVSARPTVERRDAAGAGWTGVGSAVGDGTGMWSFDDHNVRSGVRYGYRLALTEGGETTYSDVAWVEVRAAAQLGLDGFVPNPTLGSPTVSFTLPVEGPAVLEVFDLSGRRIAHRELGVMAAGSHRVSLGRADVPRVGFCVVRLTQGDRSVAGRGCVIR